MAITLNLTCIPLGLQGDLAHLDILISPHLDNTADLVLLSQWTKAILDHPDGFSLAGIGKVTIDLSPLKVDLWSRLFGSTKSLGPVANPAAGTAGSVRINPRGVSLSMTHTELRRYHGSWIARTSNLANQGAQHNTLVRLHQEIIANHGLYQLSSVPQPGPAPPPTPTPPHPGSPGGPVIMNQPHGAQMSDPASVLVGDRLGINISISPTAPGGAPRPHALRLSNVLPSTVDLAVPARAQAALPALIFNASASLQAAGGTKVDLSGAPAPTDHLIYHLERLNSSNSAASRSRMAQQSAGQTPDIDFHQQLSLIMSMPALMDALGLVLHGTVPKSALSSLSQPTAKIRLAVPSFISSVFSAAAIANDTMTNTLMNVTPPDLTFTPAAATIVSGTDTILKKTGYFDPRDNFDWGCQQLDSGTTVAVGFANQSALRQANAVAQGATDPNDVLYQTYDEDLDHPVLPPSPITGGLQVWQTGRQSRAATAVDNADTQRAATDPANPPTLWAEDLINGTIADVFVAENTQEMTDPLDLCRRDEEYTIADVKVSVKGVERGVRTAAFRRLDGGVPQAFEVDETVVNWRMGSLVAPVKSPVDGKRPDHIHSKPHSNHQSIPWTGKAFQKTIESRSKQESPLFGQRHMVSLRPAFVSGGVVPYNEDAAKNAALGPIPYLRYELIQGPQSISVTDVPGFDKVHETPSLLLVSSKLDNGKLKPITETSQRVLVPAAVKEEVARRHGIPQKQLARGARVLPLRDGAIPVALPCTDWEKGATAYLPDPLCIGVTATLMQLDGSIVSSESLNYYGNTQWPDYTPHVVELHRSSDTKASLAQDTLKSGSLDIFTKASRRLICTIPAGNTYILTLQPKLRADFVSVHALAAFIPGVIVPTPGQPVPAGEPDKSLAIASSSDVCRPTHLRLTHATDLPISAATLTLPLSFDRSAGSKFSISASAHAESTATVEVLADWNDQDDNQEQPDPVLRTSHAKLTEFTIPKRPPVLPNATQTAPDVRLPFSDGRYRRVTITPRSLSRFRDLFPEKELALSGQSYTVDFIATAKPSAPDIEFVLPNFSCNTEDKHTRSFLQGLTIIHNRGWFSSGNHEQLAVLTSPVVIGNEPYDTLLPTSTVANAENNHSAWGLLPDWTNIAPSLDSTSTIQIMPCKSSSPRNLNPDGQTLETQTTVAVGSSKYRAMLFSPEYNRLDNQWYFNINFKNGPIAMGAVTRLIVARYQQHASDDNKLSVVAACDFINLWPGRTIVINHPHWYSRKATIQIFGAGPTKDVTTPCETAEQPTTLFEVRRTRRGGSPKNGFTWGESQPWPPDPKPWKANVLWQGTIPLPLFEDHAVIVRERAIFRDAESESTSRSCTIFLDAFKL